MVHGHSGDMSEKKRMTTSSLSLAVCICITLHAGDPNDAFRRVTIGSGEFVLGRYQFTDFEKGLKAYTQSNFTNAIAAFKRAAADGEHNAEYCLGVMFLQGKGTPVNQPEGITW